MIKNLSIFMKNLKENKKRIYLDFASQSMPSKKVLKEMKKVSSFNYNPANLYKEGLFAEKVLEEARLKIARAFGVKSHEIYFTSSGTLSTAAAIFGLVYFYKNNFKNEEQEKKYLKPHIITSNIEHEAVLKNIKYLEKVGEIEATYIKADDKGLVKAEDIKKEIKENTILISIIYVNNEIGTIQEIKNIGKKIKEYKKENNLSLADYPHFHTDAAQAANYLPLYIDMLGVDMLSLNGSKIYGPKSSALLFKKEYIKLSPFYFGGGQERSIFSGTQDIEKATGLGIAVEEAAKRAKDFDLLEKIAKKRNTLLENILKNIPEAKLNGAYSESDWKKEKLGIKREERIAKRVPSNISLWLPDFPSDEMVLRLDERDYAISSGSACSAKEEEYSETIFAISNSKKRGRETIRITINENTKEKDLKNFLKDLKEIYYQYKK